MRKGRGLSGEVLVALVLAVGVLGCGNGTAGPADSGGTDAQADVATPDPGSSDPGTADADPDGVADALADAPRDPGPDPFEPQDAPLPSDLPNDTVNEVSGPDNGTDVEAPPSCPLVGPPQVWGTLSSQDLDEVSGLVASRTHPGILWAHNDSGDSARFFAVDQATGATVGEFAMAGVTAIDFEDIAIGPFEGIEGDALFLADVGDNTAGRASVVIHVVAEPSPQSEGSVEVQPHAAIVLAYPDGPVDCESLFVDPRTGDLFLVAKEVFGKTGTARVFRKAAPHDPLDALSILDEIARVPVLISTGADISPDGTWIAIRTYVGGGLFRREANQTVAQALAHEPCELPSPMEEVPPASFEPQGEAIALLPDGSGYLTVSELKKDGPPQELHFWSLDPAM